MQGEATNGEGRREEKLGQVRENAKQRTLRLDIRRTEIEIECLTGRKKNARDKHKSKELNKEVEGQREADGDQAEKKHNEQ